jgi:hypothetical protein
LAFAAIAFAFSVGGRVILAGSAGMSIRENDHRGDDYQGGREQSYGQIALHVTFLV